ncbi:uncharacterized protein LOC132271410 [Cornus florida]|uniref:uncharacterized protein LOC132271410 n=1 Tax=Cornus florida TaxID=4283 RepID=UPI00289DACC9|nr:uncharacterized protein LOC132271410 [Cornus florida]
MAQKRKMEVSVVDENDRVLYTNFRKVANHLSQLYSQALSYQKLVFGAGQRHALEKMNDWMAMKQQEGKIVTVADICTYLQEQLNNSVPNSQLQEQSDAPQKGQMDLGLGLSSSAPLMQSPVTDGHTFSSQDIEMEINAEDPIHP